MSEIITRTITGAILVAVVIIATSYNLYTSIGLWLMLAILGIRELKSNTMGGKLGVIYLLIASLSVVCLGFFDYDGLEFSLNTSCFLRLHIFAVFGSYKSICSKISKPIMVGLLRLTFLDEHPMDEASAKSEPIYMDFGVQFGVTLL